MRSEPERDPAGRGRVRQRRRDEAPLEADRALRIAGRLEREPIRLCLVAARDEVLDRQGPEVEQERDQQTERHDRGVAEPSLPLGRACEQKHAGDCEEREPSEALPEVPAPDMRELVGRDREQLASRKPAVQNRVVEDDAPRRPDPDDVGVRRRRAAAGVRNLHLVDIDAFPGRETLDLPREGSVLERLEAVRKRLDDERLEHDEEDGETDECGRTRQPPPGPEPPREQHRARNGDGNEDCLDPELRSLVGEPASITLAGKIVAARPPMAHCGKRQPGQPDREDHGEPDSDPGPHCSPSHAAHPGREGARERHKEPDNSDLKGQRPQQEPPGDAPVLVDFRELGSSEEGFRVQLREVEGRNLRPPQQGSRHDPRDKRQDGHEGLR